jgi:branched-subunit amino acid transport protein
MTDYGSLVIWMAIAVVAVGTWVFRTVFVVLFGLLDDVPQRVHRILALIPAAVIAAIVAPDLFLREGTLAVGIDNEQLLAGIVAFVVAWYTENMFVTIVVGMGTLWALLFIV